MLLIWKKYWYKITCRKESEAKYSAFLAITASY